jgi:hypothetical protein
MCLPRLASTSLAPPPQRRRARRYGLAGMTDAQAGLRAIGWPRMASTWLALPPQRAAARVATGLPA